MTIKLTGEVVRPADSGSNSDLPWACRGGGGGNFGIAVYHEDSWKAESDPPRRHMLNASSSHSEPRRSNCAHRI